MRTILSLVASLSCFVGCAAAPSATVREFQTRLAGELDPAEALEQRGALAVTVIENGNPVFARGFGYANVAERRPMTAHTPVNFASVSKSVSAWLFIHFLERHHISLNASLVSLSRTYLPPESRFDFGEVTFARILSPPYSPPFLLRRRQAPRLRRFARSRILTGQASTPAVRSVAKRRSHGTWRPLATEGW